MEKSLEESKFRIEPATEVQISSTRKRVTRACDECRLHKSRCDGTKSCATCSQTGRECSYSILPSDIKGPKAKIRILQRRLFRAQQVIQDLQKQVPGYEPLDDCIYSDSSPELMSAAAHPSVTTLPPANVSPGTDRGSNDAFNATLIQSLLQPISGHDKVTALRTSTAARSILSGPIGSQESTVQTFCQLIPYPSMLEIVYAAFKNVFTLCNIVPEQDFRVRTQKLYDVSPIVYQPEDTAFMPLFFAVIALGMAYSSNLHPNLDYLQILRESESYSRAAMTTVSIEHECKSHIHLQIALCRVLYLLNTSRVDLAHSALQLVCRSSMVQQLIRNVSTREPESLDFSAMIPRDVVWTVFYLDMHLSSLSNVLPSLHKPGPEMATVYAINTAIYNAVNYRRSETTFLLSVAVAMAIELIKLTQSMSCGLESTRIPSNSKSVQVEAVTRNSLTRDELRIQYETWEALLQTAFPDDDCNPSLSMARRQLQMHLHLARITLHHHSLGTRSQVVSWNHVPCVNERKEEDVCIEAAVDAVKYASSYLKQNQTDVIPWHSAYTIFISAITLLTAATFMNSSDRQSIQGTIDNAVLILSSTTYGSWHARSCYLQFIQTLSEILKPTTLSKPGRTRNSSFSSDTSTLVPLNESLTPFAAHSVPASLRSIPHQSKSLEFCRPMVNSDGATNLTSEWGFD